MNYIHCITRKTISSERFTAVEVGKQPETQDSEKEQRKIIREYLVENMGLEIEKRKGAYRLKNNDKYELSWKTDFRGSGNSKFGESITGIELFKSGVPQSESHLHEGRTKRFEKGDILITPKYSVLFGDHARHILEIIGQVVGYYKGRFISCDLGEITFKNQSGKILFTILNTIANIRSEKGREMNLKWKREGKKKGMFLGGHKTPFGSNWKSYADGSLYKLTPQDRKMLSQGKPGFGHYINANGELVPNKTEQEAIKEMKKLRSKGLSYMKISKKIEEMFGTNKDTKEPNVKISHTGVYRIINPHNKPTSRIPKE